MAWRHLPHVIHGQRVITANHRLLILLAVANRKPVTVSLDPFTPDIPEIAVEVPAPVGENRVEPTERAPR